MIQVRGGVARGTRLALDLRREKAYWLGHYEPEAQSFLESHVGAGDVVYDLGAHVGFFSICAGRLGAKVYAFEPLARNAARIRRQADMNGLPIEVVEAAVWDSDGGVHLEDGDSDSEWRAAEGGAVASIRLDDFASHHDPPTFVKIDVEGAEGRVLRGAEAMIRRYRPTILCEVHGDELRGEVLGLLEGYEFENVGSEWRIGATPRRHTIEA